MSMAVLSKHQKREMTHFWVYLLAHVTYFNDSSPKVDKKIGTLYQYK